MKKPRYNPFRIHGVVGGEYFTNRTDEIEQMMGALADIGLIAVD